MSFLNYAEEWKLLIYLYYVARVAQWIERWTSNPKVAGSSPAVGTIYLLACTKSV